MTAVEKIRAALVACDGAIAKDALILAVDALQEIVDLDEGAWETGGMEEAALVALEKIHYVVTGSGKRNAGAPGEAPAPDVTFHCLTCGTPIAHRTAPCRCRGGLRSVLEAKPC